MPIVSTQKVTLTRVSVIGKVNKNQHPKNHIKRTIYGSWTDLSKALGRRMASMAVIPSSKYFRTRERRYIVRVRIQKWYRFRVHCSPWERTLPRLMKSNQAKSKQTQHGETYKKPFDKKHIFNSWINEFIEKTIECPAPTQPLKRLSESSRQLINKFRWGLNIMRGTNKNVKK